jgi:hypothetical protein
LSAIPGPKDRTVVTTWRTFETCPPCREAQVPAIPLDHRDPLRPDVSGERKEDVLDPCQNGTPRRLQAQARRPGFQPLVTSDSSFVPEGPITGI